MQKTNSLIHQGLRLPVWFLTYRSNIKKQLIWQVKQMLFQHIKLWIYRQLYIWYRY